MVVQEEPVTIRASQEADYDAIAALWTRINRELAPADMRELFEQYIAIAINGELRQLQEVFSEAKRNAFWVVESSKQIIGTFGIESHSDDSTELRRCTSIEVSEAAGLRSVCWNVPSRGRLSLVFQK
jgi:hypothetical protein